jgi:hypothetical protein
MWLEELEKMWRNVWDLMALFWEGKKDNGVVGRTEKKKKEIYLKSSQQSQACGAYL